MLFCYNSDFFISKTKTFKWRKVPFFKCIYRCAHLFKRSWWGAQAWSRSLALPRRPLLYWSPPPPRGRGLRSRPIRTLPSKCNNNKNTNNNQHDGSCLLIDRQKRMIVQNPCNKHHGILFATCFKVSLLYYTKLCCPVSLLTVFKLR